MKKTITYKDSFLKFWGKPFSSGEYYLYVQKQTDKKPYRIILSSLEEAEEVSGELATKWRKEMDEKNNGTLSVSEEVKLPPLENLDLEQLLALQAAAGQLAERKREEAEAIAIRDKIAQALATAPLSRLQAAYAALLGAPAGDVKRKSGSRPRSERFKLPEGEGYFKNPATGQTWSGRGRWPAWAEEARSNGSILNYWVSESQKSAAEAAAQS